MVLTSDGNEVIIPNSEMVSNLLVNWTMNNNYTRLHIPFSTAYNNDKELIRKVVAEAAKTVPCTLSDPSFSEPQVWLVKFGTDSLDFELVVWVNYKRNSHTDSKEGDYLWAIETALRANNIELPTPHLYVKNLAHY